MKSIFITAAIIALVGVATGSVPHTRYLPLGRPSLSRAEAVARASGLCFQTGQIICSKDCNQLFLCVQDEGLWVPILIETCNAGSYCNASDGRCTPNLSTCSPTEPPVYQLNCSATGHFPDPYDCTVYHECRTIASPSEVSACQSGWSYNALTTVCDHRLSTGNCFVNGTIPPCTAAGQSGPVPENNNIYYVCLHTDNGLVYELFKCAHGGHYSAGKCTGN